MAWSTPTSRSTGYLVTSSTWNQDAVDNPIALRVGSIATTGQANGHFVVATSSTQLSTKKNAYVKVFCEVFS